VISIKGGVNPETHKPDGSAKNTHRTLTDCIAQLKGRKHLDIFEQARRDQAVDMKETFDVMQGDYVEKKKLSGISLSEVRAETIHEAVKHVKVCAVECELSL
jgi:pyridoxine 4-dehydrogenase